MGFSNQFEPSMVFDPSEFEAPKFDCTVKSPLFRGVQIFVAFVGRLIYEIKNPTNNETWEAV
jgi:hypothetical protein